MHRIMIITMAISLAACASPRERCEARVNKGQRVLDNLIATTAGNIERGYALDNRNAVTTGLQLCSGPSAHAHFCVGRQTTSKPTPITIDMAAERRKLADLKAKRAERAQLAPLQIAQCEATQ